MMDHFVKFMPPSPNTEGIYFAHNENDEGVRNPLRAHLTGVGNRARDFADIFEARDSAYVAGLLHDLGKYGDLFQRRLEGKESGLDHWSIGASVCLEKFKREGIAPALAIQGHHLGLQWWERDELKKLWPTELEKYIPESRRLTERDPNVLLERFRADGLTLPDKVSGMPLDPKSAAAMLDVRMLFSALTDADYLETEEHFKPEAAEMREPSIDLRPGEAVESWIAIWRSWPQNRVRRLP